MKGMPDQVRSGKTVRQPAPKKRPETPPAGDVTDTGQGEKTEKEE